MDNSLLALCDAIKKILNQLKPQQNQLSFIIMTGKSEQGKSALLKQSAMEEFPVLCEHNTKVYFNQQGIIVEIGENWLTNSNTLIQSTLKQLNKCHHLLKITGLILCLSVYDLLLTEPSQLPDLKKSHLQLLERFGTNLGYPVELSLIITKLDTLAGFSEFYQLDHSSDLSQPLGFSLNCMNQVSFKLASFTQHFNQLIETLNQQVIQKIHPVRSTMRRSLIRELPIQFSSIRAPVHALIQGISPKLFHLNSIYFTSAEQGGLSFDKLNRKIQHEYSLVVQDTFVQAVNFRAYFVEGALKLIQEQASQSPQIKKYPYRVVTAVMSSLACISLLMLGIHHYKTACLLDEASKELLAYDVLNANGAHSSQALYHLSKATEKIDRIKSNSISLPTIHQLKLNLHNNTHNRVQEEFLPSLTQKLEQVINDPNNTPLTRYKALKIYLMISDPKHWEAKEIYAWFEQHWSANPDHSNKQLTLLRQSLKSPLKNLPIKQQVILDARNYLNALPTSYLYYALAKEAFPSARQKISIPGFHLASNELPFYYTKPGFESVMQNLDHISQVLSSENWVLARQDLSELTPMLTQAYCYDYVLWWQNFLKKTQLKHYQEYQEGRELTQTLNRYQSLNTLTHLIQQATKPDLKNNNSQFNQLIAYQFTDFSLISQSNIQELTLKIDELERFIATLSVVNDEGKTAFALTKSRFINDNASDPLSLIFTQAKQLPAPLNTWIKQLASDSWVLLLKDSKQYINQQWQTTTYKEYQKTIAKRYPFDSSQLEDIEIDNFNRFFSTHGTLNTFTEQYIKPFLDLSSAQWKQKAVNEFVLPISTETIDQLIRANIITNMFFPDHTEASKINFSLQKISLDPVISSLELEIGNTKLNDNQNSDSNIQFIWPELDAKLTLNSIDGNHYELSEQGTWALFKLLEKVNVLIDEQNSANLQILFEVNSNSGRYFLKTNNQVNPFTPGILNGFTLNKIIV